MTSAATLDRPTPATTDQRRDIGLLTLTTVAVGISNYAMSLAVVRLLPAEQFTVFAAAQGLLLVLGTGSLAAVPWAVARHLARAGGGDDARRTGMWFGLVASAVQGVVLAAVAFVVCWSLGGPLLGVVAAVGGALISLMAAPIGWFQGLGRLRTLAALRSVETAVRIVASLALLAAVSPRADLALLGFPIGSAAAVAFSLYRARAAFPLQRMERARAADLVRQAVGLGVVQVLLAAIAALDTVYAAAGSFAATDGASYQSAALLARVPLFFSSAVSIAAYTSLVVAVGDAEVGRRLRECLRTYAWLTAPFLLVATTVPASLLDLLIPAEYGATAHVLRVLGLAGAAVGVVNVVTTAHQARGRYRTCIVVLCVAVVVQAAVALAAGRTGDLTVFTVAVTAVAVVAAVVVSADARRWLLAAARPNLRPAIAVVVALALVAVVVPSTVVWVVAVLAVTAVCGVNAVRGGRGPDGASPGVPHPSSSEQHLSTP